MSEAVKQILRRADKNLVETWCKGHELTLAVPERDQRLKWLGEIFPVLALDRAQSLGQMRAEADRIADLAKPSRDWVFRAVGTNFPRLPADILRAEEPESRALGLWLKDDATFEWAERRARAVARTDKPKLCTRFRCQPDTDVRLSDSGLRPFVATLRALYRNHDYSGKDLLPELDRYMDANGQLAEYLLHVSVSRPVSFERSFEGDQLDDIALRRPTGWSCRYRLRTGELDIICDRGGKSLRQNSADAFVELVLKQEEPPIAVQAPPFDLEFLADSAALPALDGLAEWRVTELVLSPSDDDTSVFTVRSDIDAWEAARRLTGAERGEVGEFVLISANVEAGFHEGFGRSGRAEKIVSIELLQDGTVKSNSESDRHRLVRHALAEHLKTGR